MRIYIYIFVQQNDDWIQNGRQIHEQLNRQNLLLIGTTPVIWQTQYKQIMWFNIL